MKINPVEPARVFHVGLSGDIALRHCADIYLDPDEMVTFRTQSGTEHDVTRKDWGYYATSSVNSRLRTRGMRAALVRNKTGRTFVVLVEAGREDLFVDYLSEERQVLELWLDDDHILQRVVQPSCQYCGSCMRKVAIYDSPPTGENRFPLREGEEYFRALMQCPTCRHVVNLHTMDLSRLYEAAYVDTAYADGLKAHFEKIIALPPERSDNDARVRRVVQFMQDTSHQPLSVLDVGSGLCVFLYRLKAETGWDCTALDTDPRQVAHAREVAGVHALQGSFDSADNLGRYGLITFNKVLEHVSEPVSMLARAKMHLAEGGVVYVELPDGEAALDAGPEREEFFIEHYHAFSPASAAMLAVRAGLRLDTLERVREPSGKYTLRAFLLA